MIKISSSLFVFFILASVHVFAQPKATRSTDFDFAASLMSYTQHPELLLPAKYFDRDLPTMVDNSLSPYFRPIFNQTGASCGQASGIGYTFTYEMCRKRDVPANLEENQFPSHFLYNFMTYDGYYGVNYLHSLEMAKMVGNPSVATYGGIAIDDGIVWISGYEKYCEAMTNRVGAIKMIRTETVDGLMNLKHWLTHHHEESASGGLAAFASGSPYGMINIPPDSPEAGKKIIKQFPGAVATHAMTIVGYNDSIKVDVNGDGQYTNHLDVNNDGKVDLQDWEIGAFKVANTYGDSWGDEGFFYMMYRTLAMNEAHGGLWGNMVHVIEVEEDYTPKMALKVTLKHNLREQIRISAAVASVVDNGTTTKHILNFPIFNFQGGKHFMQGGIYNEANKTIEIGLDITSLLSYLETDAPADFYLEVDENDPLSVGAGEMISFSLMDYTGDQLIEIESDEQNVALNNNSHSSFSIRHTPTFNKVKIQSEQIPSFDAGFMLTAGGGEQPYHWELQSPYHLQVLNQDFPIVEATPLTTVEPYDKYAVQTLDFGFPFYGETYEKVYVNKAGFILFEPDIFPWRYNRDTYHLFREMKNISAFLFAPVMFYEGTKQPEGMWYEGDETHASFRWKQPLTYYDNHIGEGEFAVTLFPDGSIIFYYNDMLLNENVLWFGGVSAGEGKDFTLLPGGNSMRFPQHQAYRLMPELLPEEVDLLTDGFFTSSSTTSEKITNITAKVTDQQGIFDVKTLQWTQDLSFKTALHTDDQLMPHNGSHLTVDLMLSNIAYQNLTAVEATLVIDDEFVTLTDSVEYVGVIPFNDSLTLMNAFAFNIADFCPDGHTLLARLQFTTSEGNRQGEFFIQVAASQLQMNQFFVDDFDNNKLDPGETAPVTFTLKNAGSLPATGVMVSLSSTDYFVSITPETPIAVGDMSPGSLHDVTFSITVASDCPIGHRADFVLAAADGSGMSLMVPVQMELGQYVIYLVNKTNNQQSVTAIAQVLDSLNLAYTVSESLTEAMMQYRAVLICNGTYQTSVVLTDVEVELLASYMNQGGNVYRESFYRWGGQGALTRLFGIDAVNLPVPQYFTTVYGMENTGFAGLQMEHVSAVSFMFNRLIGKYPTAFPVLRTNLADDSHAAIAYQGPQYRSIGSLVEFGALAPDDFQSRMALMHAILGFFKMEHLILNQAEFPDETVDPHLAKVFPNPFERNFTIDLKNLPHGNVHLELLSIDGRILSVMDKTIEANLLDLRLKTEELHFGIHNLKRGVYFLKIETSKKQQILRLIKQ
jgi:hypothetical protein